MFAGSAIHAPWAKPNIHCTSGGQRGKREGDDGRPELRVHDLRHTAASVWLASGADPKVVQRVLGHATAAMTMDLYGHMIDRNLWDAAKRLGGTAGRRTRR